VALAISVIIPTYNGAAFLARTLAAVFAQTLAPREIQLVDDLSTDGTVELAQALVRQSPVPASVIVLPSNSGGPAHPVNVGVTRASSPYVALCEQDDSMLPRKLEMLSGCLEREPELGLVLSRYRVLRPETLPTRSPLVDDSYSQFERIDKRSLGGPFYCLDRAAAHCAALERCYAASLSNMLVRKSVWQQLVGLDEKICSVADHDFLLRLSQDYLIGWVDEPLWEFQRHADSLLQRSTLLRCAEDYGRVWRKEFAQARSASQRTAVRQLLRQNRLDCAYQYRQNGRYGTALGYYARSLWETGWSAPATVGIAKLLPHYLWRGLWQRGKRGSQEA
jgi:glycosyltransferase involved in cell wall biosynthesis